MNLGPWLGTQTLVPPTGSDTLCGPVQAPSTTPGTPGLPRQEPRAQQLLRMGILKKPKGKGILKKPEGKAKSEWGKELAFLLFGASCHQRLICV